MKTFEPTNKQTELKDDIRESKRSINYLRARLADEFVAGNETAAIEIANSILVDEKAIVDSQIKLCNIRRMNFNAMKVRVLRNTPVTV